jgi:NADPH2:quinone reductase
MMKAILCPELGGPENLVLAEIAEPVPGPGEVLVRVKVAGLNFFDTLMLAGKYQFRPELPFSPGAECAGTVEALGEGVSGWRIGARVASFPGFNCCREKIVVRADRLLAVPDDVSDEQAAGLIVTYGTSLHALKDRAQLEPGETLAVLGAAGGVGLAAVEIGHAIGARVIACASSPDKLALAREHGAEMTLDYACEDLKEGLRRVTDGKGVDVIYDPVGGDLSEAALRSVAWQGRFLVVGFAAGSIPKIPLNLALLKGCDILGVFWGSFVERDPEAHRANMAQIFAWTAEKKLSAYVHGVFPLAETAAALDQLVKRQAKGKVLVRV